MLLLVSIILLLKSKEELMKDKSIFEVEIGVVEVPNVLVVELIFVELEPLFHNLSENQ